VEEAFFVVLCLTPKLHPAQLALPGAWRAARGSQRDSTLHLKVELVVGAAIWQIVSGL